MDANQIIQVVLSVGGSVAGILGIVGWKRLSGIIRVLVTAIEESQRSDVKHRVKDRSLIEGNRRHVDKAIEKVTGTRVKRIERHPSIQR